MRTAVWLVCSLTVVALDLLSKYWALNALVPYQPEMVIPIMNFTLAYNSGAAFSFLSQSGDWHRWFFAGFSLVMSVLLVIWLLRLPPKEKWQSLALSLILGGALGNLYDRAVYGRVIDFIQVHYQQYYWPIFNIADTAICVGAAFLFFSMFKTPESD